MKKKEERGKMGKKLELEIVNKCKGGHKKCRKGCGKTKLSWQRKGERFFRVREGFGFRTNI